MKKLLSALVIVIIFLPMFFYLNPFMWGMRRSLRYEESNRTKILIESLNKKYLLTLQVGTNEMADTIWYFRDVENHQVKKLKKFKLIFYPGDEQPIDVKMIGNYVAKFNKSFEHKKYFDTIVVALMNDSAIYKAKMK